MSRSLKVLLAAAGSHGDVLPFIGLGRELRRRGHEPHLFASGGFAPLAAQAGLAFSEVLSAADFQAVLADRDVTHSRRGMVLMAGVLARTQRRALEQLEQAHEPGRTLVVGSSLAWGTRLLGELRKAPVATLHLSPSWFRSNHRAPALGPIGHLAAAPPGLKRMLWQGMDRWFLDPLFTAPLNALRAERGLPPVQRVFQHWVHGADLTLGLFPAWFAPPQPDWPAGLQLTGFPLVDQGPDVPQALPAAVEAFLAAGDPPVAFTTGTANTASRPFFVAAVEACRLTGRRGLLLTQDDLPMPSPRTPGLLHARYVPFGALLPRLAALVHHGGIGTTSQALRAGVPQLVRPMGFDQFDNARHAVALGVARQLPSRTVRAAPLARALSGLLQDPAVSARCAAVAARLQAEPPAIPAVADAVLGLARQAGLTDPAHGDGSLPAA